MSIHTLALPPLRVQEENSISSTTLALKCDLKKKTCITLKKIKMQPLSV